MSLKRFKGGFSMTWAALVDIYLYPGKSKRAPPLIFFSLKRIQILFDFPLQFSLLILNVVMYQNICHFSRRLPEKFNFDIWVSLKVRCRDYEETCQARQLSGATWSQREFSPRRRRCTWFCSWFFLALCCTLFLSEQTWRHPTPLVATFVALWCSNCQHLCTGQYQVRHLSMT